MIYLQRYPKKQSYSNIDVDICDDTYNPEILLKLLSYMNRGFFEIGILQGKNNDNLGTLWRSANIFEAAGIFTIGARYPKKHRTDTMNTPNHIPLREYDDFETFIKTIPRDTKIIAVELDDRADNLVTFKHPERAVYILGSEDKGISENHLSQCDKVIKIPLSKNSLNVAVTGSIVLYDRLMKATKNKE